MNCQQHDNYIANADSTTGLAQIGREALDSIREVFNPEVDPGISDCELSDIRYRISLLDSEYLMIKGPFGGRFIEKGNRLYVLTNEEWLLNRNLVQPNWIGGYNYPSGAILLRSNKNSDSYCRNTVLHETLHSVSLYSRIWDKPEGIIEKHKLLSEGLTECLAGYVIAKKYPQCFSNYRLSLDLKCKIAYKPTTRLFCSLAQVVGIKPLAAFYLSKEYNFEKPWNQFIEDIHKAGFNHFAFPLDEFKAFREDLFRDKCIKLGDFKKIYNSFFKSLDFLRIP